jgi:hypothetical protein
MLHFPLNYSIKKFFQLKKKLTRTMTLLILALLAFTHCIGQSNHNIKRTEKKTYSNWMSLDYVTCLKTELPCECEKSTEYFLISLDTTRKFVLLYDGKANYDYNLFDVKLVSKNRLEVYNKTYSQALLKDTIELIGQIQFENDSLVLIEASGRRTKFLLYSTGDNHGYFYEHVKLLNAAMSTRGYNSLNKILNSDSLKCWCNWELDGGINTVFVSQNRNWILEKKDNQLYIYKWTNPPGRKIIDLKIEKKLVNKLQW